MTKSEYFALPNSERYAAAQAILKGRVCLRIYGQDVSEAGFKSAGAFLRSFGINLYRLEGGYMDCYFAEVDGIIQFHEPRKCDIILNYEFESKALIFEPTN
jgi:hypothetical protein